MEGLRKERKNVILVDSGDLLYSAGYRINELSEKNKEITDLKADLFAQTYNLMKYDIFTPGEVDLSWGIPNLKKMSQKAKFTFLLANLQEIKTKKPVFRRYLIKEIGGARVGFFGLLSSGFSESLHPRDKDSFQLTDCMQAARQVIAELKKKQCKVIVAVAHMDESEQKKLAEMFREVYFVVSGHARDVKQQPITVNNAQIINAGARGENIGQMDFFLAEKADGTHILSHYKTVPLREFYSDHPETARLVDKFRADSKPLYLSESKIAPPEKGPSAENPPTVEPGLNFVGDQACVNCHPPQTQKWKNTGHARALETLIREKRESDHTCLPCHTTGFGEATGSDVMPNVQCESCHGPRKGHPENGQKSPPVTENQCLVCHTPAKSPKFDYATYLEKIRCPAIR